MGVRFLYYSSNFAIPFLWCGYLTISYLTIRTIISNSSISQNLLSIIIYSLSIHLIVPLVQPIGVVWDHDALYTAQAVQLITRRESWVPGIGSDVSRDIYSKYPVLLLIEASLHYVTSIDLNLIQQYLMLIYSPLYLIGVFVFMKKATGDSHLAIFSTFLYATNPEIEFLTTYTSYQGLGYVFAMLVFLSFYGKHPKSVCIFLIFSSILALTHHWASYNVIAFLVIVTIFLHKSKGKSITFNMPIWYGYISFLVIMVASWHMFVGVYTIQWHVGVLSDLLQSILHLHTAIEGELTYSFGPRRPFIELFFNYLGLITFVCLGLVGSITSQKRRQKLESYMFLFGLSISFANYFIFPWHLFPFSVGMRTRIFDYAYLYMVPASIVGAFQIRSFLSRKLGKNEIYVFLILILLLTPPTIINFPKQYYSFNVGEIKKGLETGHIGSTEWMETSQWFIDFVPVETGILGGTIARNFIGAIATRDVDVEYLPDFLNSVSSRYHKQSYVVVIHKTILDLQGDRVFNFTLEDMHKLQNYLNLLYNTHYILIYA